jgi:DNA-binding transcriptional ArsR family regulator
LPFPYDDGIVVVVGRRLTINERAQRAAKFDASTPATPLYQLNNIDKLDLIFLALSSRHRRRMLTALSTGPEPVTDVAELAMSTLPAGLKHVRVLEKSGLVHSEKVGRTRTCYLNREALDFADAWIEKISRA